MSEEIKEEKTKKFVKKPVIEPAKDTEAGEAEIVEKDEVRTTTRTTKEVKNDEE